MPELSLKGGKEAGVVERWCEPGCSQALLQRCNGQKLLSVFGETASIMPVNAGAVMGAGSQQRMEGACTPSPAQLLILHDFLGQPWQRSKISTLVGPRPESFPACLPGSYFSVHSKPRSLAANGFPLLPQKAVAKSLALRSFTGREGTELSMQHRGRNWGPVVGWSGPCVEGKGEECLRAPGRRGERRDPESGLGSELREALIEHTYFMEEEKRGYREAEHFTSISRGPDRAGTNCPGHRLPRPARHPCAAASPE